MHVHEWSSATHCPRYQGSDPAYLELHKSLFFLFVVFLIILALCGGCGSGGIGSAAARAAESTNTAFSLNPTGATPTDAIGATGVSAGISVSLTPSLVSAPASRTIQFTADVLGAIDKLVTWKALLGTITPSGLYTAPSTAGADTVTAVSSADPSKFASATVSITPSAPLNAVSLLHFGSAGFGGDDTNVFQTALNSTASNNQTVEIPPGNYNINPLSFPNNSNVFVDAGVTVTANSGYNTGQAMLNIRSSNVTITGADASASVFHMRKAEYTSGESRHCLVIQGASNVTVSGISCNDSGGDGVYVRASTNVAIQDSIFNNNRRQGSSITGQVNHIHYLRDHFTNTNGTAPQSGIDIEPNAPGDFLLDVQIQDCYTDGNSGDGLMVSTWLMNATSQPIDVTVLRNHATGNGRFGYSGQNSDPSNAPGTVLIQDSFSDQSGSYGAAGYFYEATGAALIFKNLTVTNPHANGPSVYGDSAAVAVVRGGGGGAPLGNVHFLNVNIAITNGRTDRYFYFQDATGVTNVEFVPGTLSGATNTPPLGLLEGVGTNSIP